MDVQYIVLHRSCATHVGVAAVQAAHAAGESIRNAPISNETTVVALVAETSEDIVKLGAELELAGIHHVIVREPDIPYQGAATALGTEPMPREKVSSLLSGFKVLR